MAEERVAIRAGGESEAGGARGAERGGPREAQHETRLRALSLHPSQDPCAPDTQLAPAVSPGVTGLRRRQAQGWRVARRWTWLSTDQPHDPPFTHSVVSKKPGAWKAPRNQPVLPLRFASYRFHSV